MSIWNPAEYMKPRRPTAAYKLLTLLLYGQYSHMSVDHRGIFQLHSVYKLAILLGTKSYRVVSWLYWLEEQGYIESLTRTPNKRGAKFRVRTPSNVSYISK